VSQVTADQVTVQELKRFDDDVHWFDAHRAELLQRYADRWIAVYQQQVVGTAKHLKRLLAELRRKDLATGEVFIEYLTQRDVVLIL
jgi:uncharacterized protein DUF5678